MNLSIIDVDASCKKLKEHCDAKGYTAAGLQKALGLESSQACYKWFAGKNLPSIDNLIAISRLLDIKVDEILVTKDIELEV